MMQPKQQQQQRPLLSQEVYDRILYDEMGSGDNLDRLHQNEYASMRYIKNSIGVF